MTNAAVAGITAAPQGQVLRVTYKGQEAEITVPPDIPVVASVPGDMSLVPWSGSPRMGLRCAEAEWSSAWPVTFPNPGATRRKRMFE